VFLPCVATTSSGLVRWSGFLHDNLCVNLFVLLALDVGRIRRESRFGKRQIVTTAEQPLPTTKSVSLLRFVRQSRREIDSGYRIVISIHGTKIGEAATPHLFPIAAGVENHVKGEREPEYQPEIRDGNWKAFVCSDTERMWAEAKITYS
jgi:hypothetical protein